MRNRKGRAEKRGRGGRKREGEEGREGRRGTVEGRAQGQAQFRRLQKHTHINT